MSQVLPPDWFRRIDDSEDPLFYEQPRLVVHIDDGAIRQIGEIFSARLPQSGRLLDLMSSWRSHIPPALRPRAVTGLGLNRVEMENNPALTEIIVHDLNRDPRLPFGDRVFDGATLTVSVQYLTQPLEVFAEAGRVLREGAPLIVAFSNRMFPTKAVRIWQYLSEPDRVELVKRYFSASGMFKEIETRWPQDRQPENTEDTIMSWLQPGKIAADPVYAVIGTRKD